MKFTGTRFAYILFAFASCSESKTEENKLTDINLRIKSASTVDSSEILYPSLWIYGGPPSSKDHQRQVVDDLYHFRFVIKSSSCMVSPEIGADKHNQTTDSILTARIGRDWQQRFEYSADSLYTVDNLAISIAKKDKYILKFSKLFGLHNDKYNFYPSLEYTTYATLNDDIKLVTLEGIAVVKNHVRSVNFLRATVDIKRRKVVNVDKTSFALF